MISDEIFQLLKDLDYEDHFFNRVKINKEIIEKLKQLKVIEERDQKRGSYDKLHELWD